MGLLDDAIREHLDLKRRMGADSSELERLEAEAFAYEEAEPAIEPAEPEPPVTAAEPAIEPPSEDAGPLEPLEQVDAEFEFSEQLQEAVEVVSEAPESQKSETLDELLEETPDFLEETPEHDRLWFEQKPPRDFDFDG